MAISERMRWIPGKLNDELSRQIAIEVTKSFEKEHTPFDLRPALRREIISRLDKAAIIADQAIYRMIHQITRPRD